MKITVFLIAILAVTCSASYADTEAENEPTNVEQSLEDLQKSIIKPPSRYQEGRTYVYYFDSQILTGVPQTASHYTGFKLRAGVWLSIRKNRYVHMQMRHVSIKRTNRILPVDLPVVPVSDRFFSPINERDIESEIRSKLRIPIVFRWWYKLNGTVSDVIPHRLDPYWSTNIKLALISMLNVNMDVKVRDVMSSNGIWKETKEFEDGIEGKCHSKYSYSRFPYTLSAKRSKNLLTVVKSRDLLNCSSYPWMSHSLFINRECNETRKPISSQTETRYNATKSGANFFLRRIQIISQSVFTPNDREAGAAASFVVQTLRFIRVSTQMDFKLPESEWRPKKSGLMMLVPIPEMRLVKRDSAALMRQARASLIRLKNAYKKDKVEMYDYMRMFIETTRKMSAGDIKKIVLSEIRDKSRSIRRRMILDLLPKIATKQAIEVICELITEKELLDDETASLVSPLSSMSFVSHDQMVRKLMDTADKLTSKQKETYKSLLLLVGQLINTRYTRPVPHQKNGGHPLISRAFIRKFYKKILYRPNRILTREEKQMVVVLSLGNCRLVDPCLDILEKMVPVRRGISRSVRMKVLLAVSIMAAEAPLRVRDLVMPIYSDWREHAELRIASYLVFIQTKPSRSDLRIIAQGLVKEPSKQIRSFVQSHLQILSAMSNERCMSGIALNASRVLDDLLLPEQFGAQYSQIHIKSIRAVKKLVAGWISNNRGFLPTCAGVQLMIHVMGLDIELMDVGIHAEDLQQLLDRLLGPDGTLRLLTENESIKDLLRAVSDRTGKKMDVDYAKIWTLYEGFYDLSGLSTEATHIWRRGLIPLSRDIYNLVTKGGRLRKTIQHTMFVDRLTKIPTPFGIPFSVNHTITGHLRIDSNVTLAPNLFATTVGAMLNIKHDASMRQQMRVGADLGILTSFIDANSHIHLPRSRINTIKVGVRRQKDKERVAFRINVNRPLDESKILSLSSRLHAVQWITRGWTVPQRIPIRHRSLPAPKRRQDQLISLPAIGIRLRADKLLLNSTGIADFTWLPFHGPADVKVIVERDLEAGGYRCLDISGVYQTKWTSIRKFVKDVFESEDDEQDMGLSTDEQEKLISDVGRVQRRFVAVDLRLRNFTIQPLSALDGTAGITRPIGYARLYVATHSRLRGLSINGEVRKLTEDQFQWSIHLVRQLNIVMQNPRFDKKNPLKILENARALTWIRLRQRGRSVLRTTILQTVGEFWKDVIERIKRNPRKILLNNKDLQECQRQMKWRPDSPACLQAWREINTLSRMKVFLYVSEKAPHLLQMIPLTVHNAMRQWLRESHVSSNLTKTDTSTFRKLVLDLQLSPYNTSVITAFVSAMNIIDRYDNAPLPVSLRNSLTWLPRQNLMANLFEKLYPATCQIVSSPRRLQVRTFDGLDYHVMNPFQGKSGGRIILVQDIKKRLQVSEIRARGYRVTFIRLREKGHRVMVVTDDSKYPEVPRPRVMYKGRWQPLPFELKNKKGKVILRAVRERTPRSWQTIAVQLPALGSVVRTHPLISTDIVLDPFFHSTVRGLCGDFDGEIRDDLRGPLCRVVYQHPVPIHLVERYSTKLKNAPWLRRVEMMFSMTRLIPTKMCPRNRSYPLVQ